jgi:hypothetical protein
MLVTRGFAVVSSFTVKVISSRLVTPLPDEIILITGLVVSFAMVNNFGDGAAVFPQLSFAHA